MTGHIDLKTIINDPELLNMVSEGRPEMAEFLKFCSTKGIESTEIKSIEQMPEFIKNMYNISKMSKKMNLDMHARSEKMGPVQMIQIWYQNLRGQDWGTAQQISTLLKPNKKISYITIRRKYFISLLTQYHPYLVVLLHLDDCETILLKLLLKRFSGKSFQRNLSTFLEL